MLNARVNRQRPYALLVYVLPARHPLLLQNAHLQQIAKTQQNLFALQENAAHAARVLNVRRSLQRHLSAIKERAKTSSAKIQLWIARTIQNQCASVESARPAKVIVNVSLAREIRLIARRVHAPSLFTYAK